MADEKNTKITGQFTGEPDFEIGPDGTLIKPLTEHGRSVIRVAPAQAQGKEQEPYLVPGGPGAVFRTRKEAAEFVRRLEAEGFAFVGKEHLAGVL